MATKDWKKIGKEQWFKNGTGLLSINSLTQMPNYKEVYSVNLSNNMNNGYWIGTGKKLYGYTTKLKALAYAKAYMRKH